MTRFHPSPIDLRAGPPPEVLAQIDGAWERAEDFLAAGLELHFEPGGESGRVSAELRREDGSAIERLTLSEALALACGDVWTDLLPSG